MLGSSYQNKESLIESIRNHYKELGYVIKIRRSDTKKQTVTIVCDRSGKYENRFNLTESSRQRQTSSRLIECPFFLKAKQVKSDSEKKWTIISLHEQHNHPPSVSLLGHPSVRRLKDEEKEAVQRMASSGIRPSEILSVIKKEFNNQTAIRRTIYNEISKGKNIFLNGRSPIQALLDVLKNGPYEVSFEVDDDGHIKSLYFTHQQSIAFCHQFPHVFIMDCTYKTNRFKMPLLNIIGIFLKLNILLL